MSEPMLHMKIWCLLPELMLLCPNICYTRIWDYFLSELMLHTQMCNVRSHVTRENSMSRVRTHITYKMCNVRIYVLHEYAIIFCPK